MEVKKIVHMAMLTAVALILFTVEAQIPTPVPLPGVKLGLANIVTVYAMFVLGPKPTLLILVARIALGSIFAGQAMSLLYSMAGGLLCYLAMVILRRLASPKEIWACSAVSALFHNIGQLAAALAITGSGAVLVYLPHLVIAGILTGSFTGICAQMVVNRLSRLE